MLVYKYENSRTLRHEELSFDYVVIGGGLTGVCSALAAAREGAKVALIQDRPVLGGNASSEVRLWALGATSHMGNNNRWSREGGIIDEILVENTYRNKEGNPVLFDMVLIDKILSEGNITLLLNTIVHKVAMQDAHHIKSIDAFNPQNGTEYTIAGKIFADCTGDGTIGYLAGAAFRVGAEEKGEFEEGFAPDKQKYGEMLGHSILFYMKDTGRPTKYIAPSFALKSDEIEEYIPRLQNSQYLNVKHHGCKYWWLEYGGRLDTIADNEKIKYELWRVVYGVWNYIKNSGKFPEAANLALEWVGLFPGKRESRRFEGYYMLNQRDIIEQHTFFDAIAYGGWSIDLHPSDGVYSPMNGCNQWHSKGIYQIPYRCYLTPDINNMFLGGRLISASHVANGSTRVMCTAAYGGQAIGVAAAMSLHNNVEPSYYIDPEHIAELQKTIIRNGQFIPGLAIDDDTNKASRSTICASSTLKLGELTADGTYTPLLYPMAMLIPIQGEVPQVKMNIVAQDDTQLRVELRSSAHRGNYTPDITDAERLIELKAGSNDVTIDFGHTYTSMQYVFICFMTNPSVMLPNSNMLVSGLTSVCNYINEAVSNYGKQVPPDGIGVDEFEFWCPLRRPEGKLLAMKFTPEIDAFGTNQLQSPYQRPYLSVNGWCWDQNDTDPTLTLEWHDTQKLSRIRLYFDTDFDHAMENVQMGHYDSSMPFCIRKFEIYDMNHKLIACVNDNHQTIVTVNFATPIETSLLDIKFCDNQTNVCKALMGIYTE